jgi:hypothetical protein
MLVGNIQTQPEDKNSEHKTEP